MIAAASKMMQRAEGPSHSQIHLVAELAEVKELLRRRISSTPLESQPPSFPQAADIESGSLACDSFPRPALNNLCRAFGLSAFERKLLVLCAGVELDSSIAGLCAAAQGESTRSYPTFSLALATFPEAHWSALSPVGPLRKWRLLEVAAAPAITLSALRIDESVLHYLAGARVLDERLGGALNPIEPVSLDDLAPSHATLVKQIVSVWTLRQGAGRMPAIQLCGPDPADSRAIASAATAVIGLSLASVQCEAIPNTLAEMEVMLRLMEREAVLAGVVPFLEWDDLEPASGGDKDFSRRAARFIERIHAPAVLWSRERRKIPQREVINFEVPRSTRAEQSSAWRAALGAAAIAEPTLVDGVTQQFSLSLPAIRAAAAEASLRVNGSAHSSVERKIWEICRTRSRTRLDGLAWRIEPAAQWDDLVLPPAQSQALRQVVNHVRHRAKVYESWGFGARSARGLGMSALFAGPSGTGKTMAAEVLAGELRLDLYHIDLAATVSKYIGETEKNHRRIFDAAEESGAILLFDEADALFGKRSEVRDSHDRYANMEVSYLLQRMESYRGLAILTTNMKSALDTAFLRRLRFVVQFPFPDPIQRAEIWRRIFPKDTPTEALDFTKLSKLNIPGGNIRNIALNAAFIAVESAQLVRMSHLWTAARAEYAKLERPLTEAEIGGWP